MAERASTHWLDCARTSSKPIPSRDVCFCSAADGALRSASWSMTGRGSGWRRSGCRRGDLCGGPAESRLLSHPDNRDETVSQKIKRAAHEVQRPVFYSIAIIITAYVPIFTLQRVEGRLFRPMAWTVTFALAGALLFSMFLVPVLASIVFPRGTREWRNPLMLFLTRIYGKALGEAIRFRWVTASVAVLTLGGAVLLARTIGSEFLPHLDEGAIWARGTLATSTGPTEGTLIIDRKSTR